MCIRDSRYSIIDALAAGRKAGISLDRFLKKVSLTASRGQEGPYETALCNDASDATVQAPVMPTLDLSLIHIFTIFFYFYFPHWRDSPTIAGKSRNRVPFLLIRANGTATAASSTARIAYSQRDRQRLR